MNEDWSTEYAGFHSVKISDSFKTFRSDPAQFRQQYRRAFYEFAYEIDRRYASEMYDYIKGTIGVRVPLTFTQVDYSFLRISAEYSDFIDTHTYWCYESRRPHRSQGPTRRQPSEQAEVPRLRLHEQR